MSYLLVEHHDPRAFHHSVMDHLIESEAECCALIGLVQRMARVGYSPISTDEMDRPLLWTIQDGTRIGLVAIQTLKKSMIVTRGSPAAMDCLAGALASRNWSGHSLLGVVPSIGSLAERDAVLSDRLRTLAVRLPSSNLKPSSGRWLSEGECGCVSQKTANNWLALSHASSQTSVRLRKRIPLRVRTEASPMVECSYG